MPLASASRRHLTAQAHTTPSLWSTGRSGNKGAGRSRRPPAGPRSRPAGPRWGHVPCTSPRVDHDHACMGSSIGPVYRGRGSVFHSDGENARPGSPPTASSTVPASPPDCALRARRVGHVHERARGRLELIPVHLERGAAAHHQEELLVPRARAGILGVVLRERVTEAPAPGTGWRRRIRCRRSGAAASTLSSGPHS